MRLLRCLHCGCTHSVFPACLCGNHGSPQPGPTRPNQVQHAGTPSQRTWSRQKTLGKNQQVFRRFGAERPNQIWQSDIMYGPYLPDPNHPGKKNALTWSRLSWPRDQAGAAALAGQRPRPIRNRPTYQLLSRSYCASTGTFGSRASDLDHDEIVQAMDTL